MKIASLLRDELRLAMENIKSKPKHVRYVFNLNSYTNSEFSFFVPLWNFLVSKIQSSYFKAMTNSTSHKTLTTSVIVALLRV